MVEQVVGGVHYEAASMYEDMFEKMWSADEFPFEAESGSLFAIPKDSVHLIEQRRSMIGGRHTQHVICLQVACCEAAELRPDLPGKTVQLRVFTDPVRSCLSGHPATRTLTGKA